jgi:hypothetical protein
MTNLTEQVAGQADQWLQKLDGIQGWSAATLIFAACLVIGYGLRLWKKFPNELIPHAVILSGAVLMTLLASARPTSMPQHVWVVRNFIVGLIIGAFAWVAHWTVISRIEQFIGKKLFPDSQDTTFFKKEPVNDKPVDPKP